MSISLNEDQRARLQPLVQRELEKREWAEPEDNVMAEYVTVLLANGSPRDRVHTEMDDLVGSDFHPDFLDWLFDTAADLVYVPVRRESSPPPREREREQDRELLPDRGRDQSRERERERERSPPRTRRMFDTALGGLESNKRKQPSSTGDVQNKRRISDGPVGAPGGPRAMMGGEGRGLAERMGPRALGNANPVARGGAGMQVRGMAPGMGGRNGVGMGGGGGGGFAAGGGGGFRNNNGMMHQGGFGFFQPGQQEMMAQMMMMQANMAQMGEMMQQMAEEKQSVPEINQGAASSARPARPPPVKVPHGTKLGGHSVSAITPKPSSAPGPIPEKPSSKALCRYSVGCSNARCPYSHPSPVADEQSGMVLSDEACEEGKKCKDAECIKSHVSPAAVLGDTAGPSRLLCKYLNCTNPACAFRHEDANGNPIPPPALTAAKRQKDLPAVKAVSASASSAAAPAASSSDNEDGDYEVVMTSNGLMDGALEDKAGGEKACRYGERCTRPDCKFSHPASRPTPASRFPKPSLGSTKFNKSKKFGGTPTETDNGKGLNPSAGSFVPKPAGSEVA